MEKTTINHVWSILCEQALTNPQTGDMSYINTYNSIPVSKVNQDRGEIALKPFLVSSKWQKLGRGIVDLNIQIAIKSETDEVPKVFGEEHISLDDKTLFVSLNIDVTQLVVKNAGDYYFLVSYKYGNLKKWRDAASIPFRVDVPKEKKKSKEKSE